MATQFFRVGGFATDTLTDIICLWASMAGAIGSGNRSTFRKTGDTTGYSVTAAKTFYISRIKIWTNQSSTGIHAFSLGYADNDLGMDTTTSPTNPVQLIGDPETHDAEHAGFKWTEVTSSGTNLDLRDIIIPAAPAAKLMYMRAMPASVATEWAVTMWGFEA